MENKYWFWANTGRTPRIAFFEYSIILWIIPIMVSAIIRHGIFIFFVGMLLHMSFDIYKIIKSKNYRKMLPRLRRMLSGPVSEARPLSYKRNYFCMKIREQKIN